jgi:hypothetical protein
MSATAPRGPDAGHAYPIMEAPEWVTGCPGPSWVEVGEGMGR